MTTTQITDALSMTPTQERTSCGLIIQRQTSPSGLDAYWVAAGEVAHSEAILKARINELEAERENWRVSSVAREAVARAEAAEAMVAELRAGIGKIAGLPTDQLASPEQCSAVALAMDLLAKTPADMGAEINAMKRDLAVAMTDLGRVLKERDALRARVKELEDYAISLIAAECRRQISVEGYTPEHDDKHTDGEIARAAATYALPDWMRESRVRPIISDIDQTLMAKTWPWEIQWWKPTPNDRERELVKAGALIVAEIRRLKRASATGGAK